MMYFCRKTIIVLFLTFCMFGSNEQLAFSQVSEDEKISEEAELATDGNQQPKQSADAPEQTVDAPDQMDAEEESTPSARAINAMYDRIAVRNPQLAPDQFNSLLFTAGQHSLIIEARQGFLTRPATNDSAAPPPVGPREVFVGGILYVSQGDWTVWINGQKIGPDNLPPEILDIKVFKSYIKIKWYDAFTNQVFPIKMRSHQRFNIDTRIFLPG